MTSQHSKHPDWDLVWEKAQNRSNNRSNTDWLLDYTQSHDINQCTDEDGNTLLHRIMFLSRIVRHGYIVPFSIYFIDANIKNVSGQTALQLARGKEPTQERLHQNYLCIDFDKAEAEPNGLDALFAAIYRGDATLGDTSGVKDNGNELNPGGWSVLHFAVWYDRPDVIRALHKRFPNLDANYSSSARDPAIRLAAVRGYSNCIVALCECFPTIDAADALQAACENNHPACIATLHKCFPQLTGNELDSKCNYPALMRAVTFNNPECVDMLHSLFPAIDPTWQDQTDETVLIAAVRHPKKRPKCIPVLSEYYPNIDPNKQNRYNGNTALMCLIEQGWDACVAEFHKGFPNADANLRNNEGNTALMIAIDDDHTNEKCFLALCASFLTIDPNVRDRRGNTVLMGVISKNNSPPEDSDDEEEDATWSAESVRQFLESFPTTDANCKNRRGQTALMLAINSGPASRVGAGTSLDAQKNQIGIIAALLKHIVQI